MSTDSNEIFAPIRIDSPAPADVDTRADISAAPQEKPKTEGGFWRRIFSSVRPDNASREMLAPVQGSAYRMMPVAKVLETLKINNDGDGYLDDSASEALRIRLNRLGLTTATTISGPLRLRCSDTIPIVDISEPQASRYSSITICLYVIAWMLQSDTVTERDLRIVDSWIERFDAKADWSEVAKGTLRWLLSRRLFMTHKRKSRMGRIKRYPSVRARLMECLLRLVSDPECATPKRMKRLETIYQTLELDPTDIHADIHRAVTAATTLPTKRSDTKKGTLDTSKLQEMAQSTERAQQILATVFDNDTEAANPVKPEARQSKADTLIEIIRRLAEHDQWLREDAEALAKEYGMTLGALLERINDLAFERADEAIADDDGDNIYIDRDIAMQCLS